MSPVVNPLARAGRFTGNLISAFPKGPIGQTLYAGNHVVAKINGARMLLTSRQHQNYVDKGVAVKS